MGQAKPKAKPAKAKAAAKPQKVKKKRRVGRGVLTLISLSLLLSFALRIGGEAGLAIAANVGEGDQAETEMDSEMTSGAAEVAELMDLLKAREARVAAREEAVADRERALEVARAEVIENLEALKSAEEDLAKLVTLSSTAAEDDLARLTSVYENMKPKEAAALFSEMAPEFAAGFLGRMRADAAAAIMAGLDPAQAYTISVLLAGRNTQAPKE